MNKDTLLKHEDLPLKVLVLAQFSPHDLREGAPPREERRMAIDKETFGEVMLQLCGKVSLDFPNRLSGQPKELAITIPLTSIKSFHPEAIIEAVPELREILQIRRIVIQLRDGGLSYAAFRTELGKFRKGAEILEKAEASRSSRLTRDENNVIPAQAGIQNAGGGLDSHFRGNDGQLGGSSNEKEGALESLFEMVEVPGTGTKASGISAEAASLLNHFISLMTAGTAASGTSIDTGLVNQIIADLDSQLSAQVNEILHHPEFRRLEAVWRGLKFLVDRTDFREPIQVEVLNATKNDLAETFSRKVFEPEYERLVDIPLSVILADFEFDRSLQDTEILRELSAKAERIQVPVIASAGPAFFGIDSAGGFEQLPYLGTLFQQPEYMKWNSFRQGNSSRWVSLAFNRFLVRDLYGPESSRVKSFDYRESVTGHADKDYLWGSPVWALGTLLTASFARTGWCHEMTGPHSGGAVENLPVYSIRTQSSQSARIPLEILIPEQQAKDLSDNGIIALTCWLNSDAAVVLSAPTAHRPERYPDPKETAMSALRAALPYQTFSGRLSHHVSHIAGQTGTGQSPESLKQRFRNALVSLLSTSRRVSPDAVDVQVGASQEHPESYDISLTIFPDKAGLYGLAPVILNLLVSR